ncbi:MAG: glycoside hydrolase family 3 C-terminal domain-containing protein [Lachnospiraceae bacterium]|nr:glycoside hydrolase family 3 C-terminal domain-containing protein [Lachnospiraceae bacterium]
MKYTFDWKEYAQVARQMVSEGVVLLKNDNKALPIRSGEKVSVFGRIQFDYYKSGTGSGGMVNAPYVISILDALKEEKDVTVNESLLKVYEEWIKEHPFDVGEGWAKEPLSQLEMEVTADLASKAAAESDIALVIIGRSAGEDRDSEPGKGAYLLSDEEEQMLGAVTKAFNRVVVLLNVGSIIDMKWVDKYNPEAVMYVWQGGMEGGHGIADVLMGRVSPSGKLSDTIAYDIEDYPSTANFGSETSNHYEEDIYVGYRYFESVAKDKVMYPFGFGLSYTTFSHESAYSLTETGDVVINTTVTNTGDVPGKDVVQVYVEAPQGKLGKPAKILAGFTKTGEIPAGASESVAVSFPLKSIASFDDSGVTGHKDCYVLEADEYVFYEGSDVRSSDIIGSMSLNDTVVTLQCLDACAPTEDLERMVMSLSSDGKLTMAKEKAPKRTYDLEERIASARPVDRPCTGDKGYKFADYMRGEVSLDDYLDQLTDEDLIHMSRGEGMCSPKVTPGVAAAFGGVTDRLNKDFGMPIAACSDGPSGIRMDCGTEAFSLPSGTLQACSYNTELIEKLYEFEGMELRKNKIDSLLGPGLNIHRNPLNGRNFEYYSEDPYLTGACAVAELNGLHKYNVTGTCKHFATNNQEFHRHDVDAVISARALREIYLRAFEMAVKDGGAYCIMTTYGPLNGIYTSSNYDLDTTILRDEWAFDGLVMTDWWAKITSDTDAEPSIKNTTAMIRAQNDVYMVTADSAGNANKDDSQEGLAAGRICRGQLLRNARNICHVLKRSAVGIRLVEGDDEITVVNAPKGADKNTNYMPYVEIKDPVTILDTTNLKTEAGSYNLYTMHILVQGMYDLRLHMRSMGSDLSQTTVNISENSMLRGSLTLKGSDGEWSEHTVEIDASYQTDNYLAIHFAQTGIEVDRIEFVLKKKLDMGDKRDVSFI